MQRRSNSTERSNRWWTWSQHRHIGQGHVFSVEEVAWNPSGDGISLFCSKQESNRYRRDVQIDEPFSSKDSIWFCSNISKRLATIPCTYSNPKEGYHQRYFVDVQGTNQNQISTQWLSVNTWQSWCAKFPFFFKLIFSSLHRCLRCCARYKRQSLLARFFTIRRKVVRFVGIRMGRSVENCNFLGRFCNEKLIIFFRLDYGRRWSRNSLSERRLWYPTEKK